MHDASPSARSFDSYSVGALVAGAIALCLVAVGFAAWRAWDARPYGGAGSVGVGTVRRPELAPVYNALMRATTANGFRFPRELDAVLAVEIDGKRVVNDPSLLRDAHGRELEMRVDRDGDEETLELWSLGRDGKRGGVGDDADVLELQMTAERGNRVVVMPVTVR